MKGIRAGLVGLAFAGTLLATAAPAGASTTGISVRGTAIGHEHLVQRRHDTCAPNLHVSGTERVIFDGQSGTLAVDQCESYSQSANGNLVAQVTGTATLRVPGGAISGTISGTIAIDDQNVGHLHLTVSSLGGTRAFAGVAGTLKITGAESYSYPKPGSASEEMSISGTLYF